ncbi:hypothetical protein ACROYT_G007080 [Oculina patagonica]
MESITPARRIPLYSLCTLQRPKLTPNHHESCQMITLNGTKQQSMPVFRIAMDSLDGQTRERIEVTGSKMPEFATVRWPNMNDLKLKYEHARDTKFYVKPGDEYKIDVILGDSTYCKIKTKEIYKGKPGEPGVKDVLEIEDQGENDQLDVLKEFKDDVTRQEDGRYEELKSLIEASDVCFRQKIDVAFISGGLTSFLQPLDKCLNKPFKDNIRRKYLSWLISGWFEFTPADKNKAPNGNQVLHWVKDAWQEIPAEMVERSFKSCSISNSLDGTEDDAVYSEEMPELAEQDEMEGEFGTQTKSLLGATAYI